MILYINNIIKYLIFLGLLYLFLNFVPNNKLSNVDIFILISSIFICLLIYELLVKYLKNIDLCSNVNYENLDNTYSDHRNNQKIKNYDASYPTYNKDNCENACDTDPKCNSYSITNGANCLLSTSNKDSIKYNTIRDNSSTIYFKKPILKQAASPTIPSTVTPGATLTILPTSTPTIPSTVTPGATLTILPTATPGATLTIPPTATPGATQTIPPTATHEATPSATLPTYYDHKPGRQSIEKSCEYEINKLKFQLNALSSKMKKVDNSEIINKYYNKLINDLIQKKILSSTDIENIKLKIDSKLLNIQDIIVSLEKLNENNGTVTNDLPSDFFTPIGDKIANTWDKHYSILDTSKWMVPMPRPPVCINDSPCKVCPMNETVGGNLLEWN